MPDAQLEIRPIKQDEWDLVAELIHVSTNAWYQDHYGFDIFTGPTSNCLVFPEVYENLDPGCCIAAFDPGSGVLAGSCFYHPRETHVSLGILNVHPDHFGKGIAGKLLDFVINFAKQRDQPLRLVSSALNLDSFALYNRRGFAVTGFYQDMLIEVPNQGFTIPLPDGMTVRDASPEDAAKMADLELKLAGIRREKDFAHFIENKAKIWGVSILEKADGTLAGFLASVNHPGSRLLGPGVAEDEATAAALLARELDVRHRGAKLVFLIPSSRPKLVAFAKDLGARICELHVSQTLSDEPQPPATGIVFPTFMPETA